MKHCRVLTACAVLAFSLPLQAAEPPVKIEPLPAPNGAQAPTDAQAAPNTTQAAPADTQAAPNTTQAAPTDAQAPNGVQAAPNGAQAAPNPTQGAVIDNTMPSHAPPRVVENFGAIELQGVTTNNINHGGMLRLANATINDLLEVNGIIDVENSNLNKVAINGSGSFENSTVRGAVNVNGQMDAKSSTFDSNVTISGYLSGQASQFKQTVTIQGVNTNFLNSSLQDLILKPSNDSEMNVQIILRGTKVLGNITFAGGKGTVIMDATSSVAGEVIGGTIQKQQP